jgi:ribose transport system ATP-binding protein
MPRDTSPANPPPPPDRHQTQHSSLTLENVSKVFSGLSVLRNVNLTVNAGEIHGLVGNNGAGKSTLVKIATGTYTPSAGAKLLINGRQIDQGRGRSSYMAQDLGLRVVHQEAPLIDSFTVAETVGIFRRYPTRLGAIRWKQLRSETDSLLQRFALQVDTDARAAFLSAAERALVTLAIALADWDTDGFKPMLILDEATASVPTEEVGVYLNAVRTVADSGGGVLMVSHRLHEIIEYCQNLTVLSDGQVVYQGPTVGLSINRLIEYMRGSRETKQSPVARQRPVSLPKTWGFEGDCTKTDVTAPLMTVTNLQGPLVRDVSFSIAHGEIVGMIGLFGSGVSQIARLVAGVDSATGGGIQLGQDPPLQLRGKPHRALASGITYLSADRAHEGGIKTLTMQENAILPTVSRYWGRRRTERSRMAEALSLFDIRPRRPDLPFGLLSGGNQQKVLMAKILLSSPQVVVLDDPTVGVDPQSREAIFSVLKDFVGTGRGALVSSSEPDQLAKICDRVLVIVKGRIAQQLSGDEISADKLLLASELSGLEK